MEQVSVLMTQKREIVDKFTCGHEAFWGGARTILEKLVIILTLYL